MAKGTIRQRSAGSWELKYDLGTDPLTGRRRTKYETVRGSKRDAQRVLRDRINAAEDGTLGDAGKMTVGEWLAEWLAQAKHSTSAKTHERYTEIVQGHLIPGLGAIALAKLSPAAIQSYYAKALESGRRDGKGGLSAQTVNHLDRVLNVALKRARALGLISRNPVEDVVKPKVQREEMRTLAPDEAKALLAIVRPTRMFSPVFLALATGLRRGELLALRWSDIDLDGASLTVRQSLETTKAGLRFKEPKTKRGRRTIALSSAVVEELRSHKAAQARERLQIGLGRADLVFTKIDGDPINPDGLSKEFTAAARRAGLDGVTLHVLRHTHASDMLRANVHPKIVSERLGHASVAITLDVYSHAVPGLQEDAASRIDAALRAVLE